MRSVAVVTGTRYELSDEDYETVRKALRSLSPDLVLVGDASGIAGFACVVLPVRR